MTIRLKLIGDRTVDPSEFGPDVNVTMVTCHPCDGGGRTDVLAMTILECADDESARAVEEDAEFDDAIVSCVRVRKPGRPVTTGSAKQRMVAFRPSAAERARLEREANELGISVGQLAKQRTLIGKNSGT